MKYNCCQQSDLCPKNKICKPIKSPQQPWKRFTCECPDGYHGDNCKCNEPITSCTGYANGSRISGMYKVVGSDRSLYQVYCHFDSDGAWTLLQSYSFAKKFREFKRSLALNLPVSENVLTWSGYRLRKSRMKSIQKNTHLLRFTCDYEKYDDIKKSDYLQVPGYKKIVDVFTLKHTYKSISGHEGKIGGVKLQNCKVYLRYSNLLALHIHITRKSKCHFTQQPMSGNSLTCVLGINFHYFGNYVTRCSDKTHLCVQNSSSTSQLWLGNA